MPGPNYHKQDIRSCCTCYFSWIDFDGCCRCALEGDSLLNPTVGYTDICDEFKGEDE